MADGDNPDANKIPGSPSTKGKSDDVGDTLPSFFRRRPTPPSTSPNSALDSGADGVLSIPYWETRYKMDHKNRGICYIFNIENFTLSSGQSKREGSSQDVKKLTHTFERIGFDVKEFKDTTEKQMREILLNVAKLDFSNSDCFACWILSHGKMGSIYASDREVELEHLAHYLAADRCSTLFGKPKIFFIQACQEKEAEKKIEWRTDTKPAAARWSYRIPAFADFFFGFSTPPGFYSWRSPTAGSYYVKYFCEVFNECIASFPLVDLTQLMDMVSMKVAREFESNTYYSRPDMHGKKQIPCYMSTLTRRVYFNAKC